MINYLGNPFLASYIVERYPTSSGYILVASAIPDHLSGFALYTELLRGISEKLSTYAVQIPPMRGIMHFAGIPVRL